jgi:peroxiredoxin Q/BCP
MECKSLRESGDSIRAFDVAYFAASVDDADTNRRFAESLDADYPILSDPDKTVATAYGVVNPASGLARRWTFYIGPDGKLLAVDREVQPASAGADIATKLGELGVAKMH